MSRPKTVQTPQYQPVVTVPEGYVPLVAAPPPPSQYGYPFFPPPPPAFITAPYPIYGETMLAEQNTGEAATEAPKVEEPKADQGKAEPTAVTPATENKASWDSEKDAQLLKYKEDNRSWKQISELLEISVTELRRRFRELKQQQEEKETKITAAESSSPSSGDSKPAVPHKAKGEHTPEPSTAKSTEDSSARVQGSLPLESGRSINLIEDEKFSLEDILLLLQLAQRHDEEKWLAISSRFYDFTGRRIDPNDVRAKIG